MAILDMNSKVVKRVKRALQHRCLTEGGVIPYKENDTGWDDLAVTATLAVLGEYDPSESDM